MSSLRATGTFFQTMSKTTQVNIPLSTTNESINNKCVVQETYTEFFYSFVFNYCSELVDAGASDTGRHVAEADSPRPDESFAQQKSTLVIEFYPGSIHSEDVRAFWQNDLQAGEWVMDVLTQGYVIPFVESPPAYEEANNKSAMQDMPFVIQAVAELQKRGVIEFRDEKPLCVSPLTVSKKFGRDGITKNRLCWDGSRCVNLYVKEQKVVLSHLRRSLEITREGDFQVTYDLKAAYHHVRIHPSQTKYLGAAIPKPDGGKQYFVFLYLPFGLSSAVHCLTKLFKPVNAYIHEKGIRHSIYLDDGRIVAETKCKAEDQRTFVYKVLKSSGWILEVEKSDKDGDANQSKEYLGFIIDTASMTVRLQEAKKQRILQQVSETISHGSKSFPAKELAGTIGKIVATEPALGPIVVIAARASYAVLEEATQRRGWNSSLVMSKEAQDGLQFFVDNCSEFDNSPIRSAATEISVLSIIGPPSSFMKSSFVANHVRTNEEKIWASDASGYATCAYSIKGDHLYFRGILNEDERMLSSGHRELLAVAKTMEYYEQTGTFTTKATNIYWLTDSQNLVTFLTKGSGKRHIQKDVFQIMIRCKRLNTRITPIHLLRDDPRIKIADDGSKTTDTDNWQVDDQTFQRNRTKFKFTIDLFASNRNSKCQRFYSNFFYPGTSGIDAFSHSWDDEVAWICPPIQEIIRIVRRLKTSRTTGILFVPKWKTADYWVEIFNNEGRLLWPFNYMETCRPFIIQGTYNPHSPFAGKTKFEFLQLCFDSRL